MADVEAANGTKRSEELTEALLQNEEDAEREADTEVTDWKEQLQFLIIDILAFSLFMYIIPFWAALPNTPYYCCWLCLPVAGTLWRCYNWQQRQRGCADKPDLASKVPYTTGIYTDDLGRQLYLVATVHISPKSPEDTEAVIKEVRPDVVMIELDEERLDTMRPKKAEVPKAKDLQLLKLSGTGVAEVFGEASVRLHGQRAIWNAERCGETISGKLVFNEEDPHGLQRPFEQARDNLLLVQRGPMGLDAGKSVLSTFPVKAHRAFEGGAKAIVVIDSEEQPLPSQRLGSMGGHIVVELKVAYHCGSLGYPPIPVVMVSKSDGEKLLKLCRQPSQPLVEFEVMPDPYPRRTLRRNLCQTCLLFGSGVGFLYGIIRCFKVEVGGEFMAAEKAASEQGVPCVCIDVDMSRLFSRMLKVVIPTPWNIGRVIWSWLAVPRGLFRILFPRMDSVDTLGSMFLHAKSFPIRNWIAFMFAGFGANFISSHILQFFSGEATDAAVDGGVVNQKDAADFQVLLLNLVLIYLMPCLYEAILASRDEAMYQGICKRARVTKSRY